MGNVFAVTSGKGGVGKSTVSIGISAAFCALGKRVLLIDMDEGLRCLDLMLGMDKSAVFDLGDILAGKEFDAAVYACSDIEGLFLVPAPARLGTIDTYAFEKFASFASENYDIVIFDFPAGINLSLYGCLPETAVFLTVAVPDPVSIRDAAAVSRALAEKKLYARLVINRFIYSQSRKYDVKNIDGIIDAASLRLIGIVPESEELTMLSLRHKMSKKGRAAAAFLRIARRLLGEHILLPKPKKI